ncbi:MAG: ABC transporter substrate-binding protein [Rhodococcus sp. (in: high G+C Gram-positive bacteria)]|uniref:ABC transporter substrate-binding protein n=1 Tax=Rhodococcus sp. TaxID=1831 RepID=UPI0011F74F63|nr:ABC transporter substrate-binding protein [Rhodococcus sp. (in: high G+C Gram-positive bacteria)]RZL25431.1 MAG: ABC transporter substrate-binding protein [Rhodococcus sp. (in: high G+C Gram-positive bacteria)]
MRFPGVKMCGAAVVVAVAVTGCGGQSVASNGDLATLDASAANPSGHLRVGYFLPPRPVDPYTVPSTVAAFPYLTPLYDRLTQIVNGKNGSELAPMVATGWEFGPDGRSLTFKLRDDVTFSDGTLLDSAAVKASLERARNLPGSTVASYFSMVSDIETPDASTVTIRTNRPASDLPYVLSGVEGMLISPKAVGNPDLDVQPVGSGPYVLDSLRVGDSVSYVRRDGYWDPSAQLPERITITGFADGNARMNALRSGQIDLAYAMPGDYTQASNLGRGFGFYSYPPSTAYVVNVNTNSATMARPEIRQAMNFAIDRDGINKSILHGQCAPNPQAATPGQVGFLEDPPIRYDFDPERARQILATAGVTNLEIDMMSPARVSPVVEIATAVRSQLENIGIKVNYQEVDQAEMNTRFSQGDAYDAVLNGRVPRPSSLQSFQYWYRSPALFPGPRPAGFDETLDRAFDPALTADQQAGALEDVTSIATEQAMNVFICATPTQFAYSDKVIGATDMAMSHIQGVPDLRHVGIAK